MPSGAWFWGSGDFFRLSFPQGLISAICCVALGSGFKGRQDGLPGGQICSASSLEEESGAFPLFPAEMLRCALIGPACHVPICEPILATMWIKGSDWSGLDGAPPRLCGLRPARGGSQVLHRRVLPGGRVGGGGLQASAHPGVRVRGQSIRRQTCIVARRMLCWKWKEGSSETSSLVSFLS